MKKTGAYKIWQIIYPVGIYYVVSSLVYFALEMLLGTEKETYMLRQLLCAVATIPFVFSFYRQDRSAWETVYGKKEPGTLFRNLRQGVLAVISGAALGIAVNNIIAMTPLIEKSSGFQNANDAFFAGEIVFEFLGSCLLIPIAEELLYRGVVYKRLQVMVGVGPAILLSALLFGIMHVNPVQFLYAGILGILLAFLLEKSGFLYVPILGHIAANVAAVVRQETGWLSFSYERTAAGVGFTVLMLGIAAAAIGYLTVSERNV